MIFLWMETWLGNLFYKEMRTEQQLGYVVDAYQVSMQGNLGMSFVIQSENTEPSNISTKIDTFLVDSEKILEDMSAEDFAQICDSSEKNRCRAATSLDNQSCVFF